MYTTSFDKFISSNEKHHFWQNSTMSINNIIRFHFLHFVGVLNFCRYFQKISKMTVITEYGRERHILPTSYILFSIFRAIVFLQRK